MTPANYIALAALGVSLIMMLVNVSNNNKNQNRAENAEREQEEQRAREETAQQTGIMIALDNIKSMLADIKAEINTVKQDTRENHDKIIELTQSLKSEHRRLDQHEERLNAIEAELRERKEK